MRGLGYRGQSRGRAGGVPSLGAVLDAFGQSSESDDLEHSEGEEEEGDGEEIAEHQEGRELQAADSSLVARLPTRWLTAAEVEQLPPQAKACTICMEDFAAGSEVRTLPCLHGFHSSCVDRWFERQALCPNCKCRVDASTLAESASPTSPAGRSRSRSPVIDEPARRGARHRRRGATSHEESMPAAAVRASVGSTRGQQPQQRGRPRAYGRSSPARPPARGRGRPAQGR